MLADQTAGDAASPRTEQVKLHKGDALYRQDDNALYWFEIVDGLVRTCRYYFDGRRQITGFHFAGDSFGLEGARYWTTAEVVSEGASVLRHPFIGGSSALERVVRPELVRALHRAEQRTLLLGHRSARERVAAFLLLVAGRNMTDGVASLPMSREDIADHLGLTVETVSRMMQGLARDHLLQWDGPHRFTITDRAGLSAAAACEDEGKQEGGDWTRAASSPGQAAFLTVI